MIKRRQKQTRIKRQLFDEHEDKNADVIKNVYYDNLIHSQRYCWDCELTGMDKCKCRLKMTAVEE